MHKKIQILFFISFSIFTFTLFSCKSKKSQSLTQTSIGSTENLTDVFQSKTAADDMKIVRLILKINGVEADSQNICKVENGRLVDLYLCEMGIKTIPADIGQLDSLRNLIVTNNDLTSIPSEIWTLRSLKTFNASNCSINSVGDGESNIENLDLSNNKLSEIPSCIFKFKKLLSLNLSRNRIMVGNTSNYKVQLDNNVESNLENLDLSFNNLIEIPSYISKFKKLSYLDLSGNRLMIVGKELSQLPLLQSIVLDDNGILNMDFCVSLSQTVTSISLNDNSIEKINDSIIKLSNLKAIYLNNNRVSTIPTSVSGMKELAISAAENCITSITPQIEDRLSKGNAIYWKVNQKVRVDSTFGISETVQYCGQLVSELNRFIDEINNSDIKVDMSSKSVSPSNDPLDFSHGAELYKIKIGENECEQTDINAVFYNDSIVVADQITYYLGSSWSQWKGSVYSGMSVDELELKFGKPLFKKGKYIVYGEVSPDKNDYPVKNTPDSFYRSSIFFIDNGIVRYLIIKRFYGYC